MADLKQTGVTLFDRNFGGLLSGRPYLVLGDAGTGKSLLGLQFLTAGISRKERGLLLTSESAEVVLPKARSLGFPLDLHLESGSLILLEQDELISGRPSHRDWRPLLEALRPYAREHGIRRAVFDPVPPLLAASPDEESLGRNLRNLAHALEEWGWTTLLLDEGGLSAGHPLVSRTVSEACSGIFELQQGDGSPTRHFLVHRLRHAAGPRRRIPFQIVPRQGLVEEELSPAQARLPSDWAVIMGGRGVGQIPDAPQIRDEAAGVPPGGEERGDRAPRRTVLLVDDDPFVRRLLAKTLEREFRVLQAGDGISAITTALTEGPDLIVLDVFLPGISGFEVCRALRVSGQEVPIFLISGAACEEEDRLRGLLLGANDYISKPFNVRELVEKIRVASRHRTRPPVSLPKEDLDRVLQSAQERLVNRERFLQLCDRACADASRYGVSIALIRLCWDAKTASMGLRECLVPFLEHLTRSEDVLGLEAKETGGEAMILLTAEDASGVLAYLGNLRRLLMESLPQIFRVDLPEVTASFAVYDPSLGEKWTAEDAMMEAERIPRSLFTDSLFVAVPPGSGPEEEEEPHRTGTDG